MKKIMFIIATLTIFSANATETCILKISKLGTVSSLDCEGSPRTKSEVSEKLDMRGEQAFPVTYINRMESNGFELRAVAPSVYANGQPKYIFVRK